MMRRASASPELQKFRDQTSRMRLFVRCKVHGELASWSQKEANDRPSTIGMLIKQTVKRHAETCTETVQAGREVPNDVSWPESAMPCIKDTGVCGCPRCEAAK